MSMAKGVGPATNAVSGTSIGTTLASTTAGRGLVAIIMWFQSGSGVAVSTVTVSGESNMTVLGSPAYNGNGACQVAYLGNNTGGGSKTVTASVTPSLSSNLVLHVVEVYDTSAGSITTDASAVNTGGSSSAPSTTIATGTNNSLVVGGCYYNTVEQTPGSGYTTLFSDLTFDGAQSQYDVDVGTAGSITFNYGQVVNNWSIGVAAFKG